jgi:hypothetical protein
MAPFEELNSMNYLMRSATIVSTVALLTFGTAGLASAQYKKSGQNECADPQNCPSEQIQRSDEDEQGTGKRRKKVDQTDAEDQQADEQSRRKRRVQETEGEEQVSEEPTVRRKRSSQAQSDWKFDSKRHDRRRKRDDRYRFEFGGFWYPEPYWWYDFDYGRPYRISCREGRDILLDRGFRRVRTVECQGRTFTYLGRRGGDIYRVLVSSRTGRIVGVRPA